MSEPQLHPVIQCLLDALTLEWTDNGNISADAVRDGCLTTLASAMGLSESELETIIEKRILAMQ